LRPEDVRAKDAPTLRPKALARLLLAAGADA
jgi:hypothetical protein